MKNQDGEKEALNLENVEDFISTLKNMSAERVGMSKEDFCKKYFKEYEFVDTPVFVIAPGKPAMAESQKFSFPIIDEEIRNFYGDNKVYFYTWGVIDSPTDKKPILLIRSYISKDEKYSASEILG